MACPLTHKAGCPARCPPGAGRQSKVEPGPWDDGLWLPGLGLLRQRSQSPRSGRGPGASQGFIRIVPEDNPGGLDTASVVAPALAQAELETGRG